MLITDQVAIARCPDPRSDVRLWYVPGGSAAATAAGVI